MGTQLDFAVIADDLTGACDCGAQLVLAQYRTVVYLDEISNPIPINTDAIAINTETRLLSASEAYEKVYQAGYRVKEAKIVYKKIDSALRGPIGAELAGAIESTGRRISIVAPALPNQGRITKQGIQLHYGKPIDQTELAKDPITPIKHSLISSLLENSGLGPIANVTTEDLKNQNYMDYVLQNNRLVIADAETNEHLDDLIRSVIKPSDVLWVGSAGLAGALGRCYPNPIRYSPGSPPVQSLRTLVVIGSLSQVAQQQIAYVSKHNLVSTISLDLSFITSNSTQLIINSTVHNASKYLSAGKSVLIHYRQESPHNTHLAKKVRFEDATFLCNLLAQIVVELSEKNLFDALILSGGETASTVTRQLGSWGINLLGELDSGIPYGTLLGGHQYFVITKSGSFGVEDTLYHCIFALNKPGGLCHTL